MAWGGFGSTPQTKPTYLADLYVAQGYVGLRAQFMRDNFIPIGDTDSTKSPPCDVIVGRVLKFPGKPDVTVGTASGFKVAFAMPGGGTCEIHYNC